MMSFSSPPLVVIPPQRPSPTAHPRRVDTRNEICLTANEILLHKMKSNKLDEIPLCGVADERSANKQYRASVRICHAERSRSIPRKGSSFPFVTKKHNRTKKFDSNAKGFSVGGFTKSLHNIRKYIPDVVMLSSGNPFVWKPSRNLCLHTRATAAQHNNGIFRMGAMRLI